MENSFRFFSNRDCKYYPCHRIEKEEELNCLFCYCPLYLLEECGGNYKMTNGVKDCSDCLVPHRPNGYDHINKVLGEEISRRREINLSK